MEPASRVDRSGKRDCKMLDDPRMIETADQLQPYSMSREIVQILSSNVLHAQLHARVRAIVRTSARFTRVIRDA